MQAFFHYLKLAGISYVTFGKERSSRLNVKRFFVISIFYAVFFPWLFFNSICLALDHLFFGFKKIQPRTPLFVVGVPRSGTTFLYRLISMDREQVTTMPLWELILAPSLLQKYSLAALGWLDRTIFFGVFKKLILGCEKVVFGSLDSIHKTSLFEPEEDYLALIPVLGCFLMIQPFPDSTEIWKLANFDRDVDASRREKVMRSYRQVIQRHLYFRGNDKILLSKNPSFSSMTGSLRETFPDCQIVGCVRHPHQTIPSLLNSMEEGSRPFGNQLSREHFHLRLVQMMEGYYRAIFDNAEKGNLIVSDYQKLTTAPDKLVADIYDYFALNMNDEFRHKLLEQAERSRGYRSGHRYAIEDFGMSEADLSERFQNAIASIEALNTGENA